MSLIKFKEIRFRQDSLDLIEVCNEIIAEYQAQELRLTLRQIFYQLVSRNIIPNIERSYKNLSSLLSDARLAGLIDWDAIEDRIRQPRRPSEFTDLSDLIAAAIRAYRLPRWDGQEYYVELWTEKDAIAGVLAPLASKYHVTMMVNRGFSSWSAMFDAAVGRFQATGKPGIIFYLGDHDPSGLSMILDIENRLNVFLESSPVNVAVRQVALTRDQIDQYSPPGQTVKPADSRAREYIAAHGNLSWEVDALRPDVLQSIIRSAFEDVLDVRLMNRVIRREKSDIKKLRGWVHDNRGRG